MNSLLKMNTLVGISVLIHLVSIVEPKNVFAHYMMGNSYNSNYGTFTNDIKLASSYGIDGFALNIGPDYWQPDRISQMFSASTQFPSFKLFFSFDMSVMSDPNILISYCEQYAYHSNSFYYKNKYFVSTFAGENLNFGYPTVNDGWQNAFKTPLANEGIYIYFVPSWTALGPYDIFENYPVLDGMFSWAAWPSGNYPMNTDEDLLYIDDANRNGKTYMAPLSPWFFTHFSYKNWIYKSENLLVDRWKEIMNLNVDLVEMISWNDFGESHYMGPVQGAMPDGSEVWCNGYDHQAWLKLSSYFISAFKTGNYPPINNDQVYFWYRTSSKNTYCGDPIGMPDNHDWADDNIVIFALLTSSAQINVTCGHNSQQFNGNQGSNFFTMGFGEGNVSVSLSRNGQWLGSIQGALPINNTISNYNFNAMVGVLEHFFEEPSSLQTNNVILLNDDE